LEICPLAQARFAGVKAKALGWMAWRRRSI
jgi:hypothetical protein